MVLATKLPPALLTETSVVVASSDRTLLPVLVLATEGSAPGVVLLSAGTRRQDQSHFMTPSSCQPTQSQHGDLTDSAAKLTTVTEPYGDPIRRTTQTGYVCVLRSRAKQTMICVTLE